MMSETDKSVKLNTFFCEFMIPQKRLEDIAVWVHELTELALISVIQSIGEEGQTKIYAVIDGGLGVTSIEHIITSLCCDSLINSVHHNPEDFWRLIKSGIFPDSRTIKPIAERL